MPPAEQATWDANARDRQTIGGPASMLMYSPVLAGRVSDVTNYLRYHTLLAPSFRELAMLATAREKDCPYIWAAHAGIARQAGVADQTIATVANRSDLTGTPPAERGVIDYVQQTHRQHRVASDLFDRLRDQYGIPWLVELTCLTGHYSLLAGIVNAFEVSPAPDAEQLPL